MPNPKPITLTPEIVAAHERLYPRLAALLKQIERVAGRRAGAEVPAQTVALARRLCDETRKLLGREGRGIGVGQNPDATGLALALGQAVAALEAFEAIHSGPDRSGVVVWRIAGEAARPVARLRPTKPGPLNPWQRAAAAGSQYDESPEKMRSIVMKRIIERENAVYLRGYQDAQAGRPPRKPVTEMGPP